MIAQGVHDDKANKTQVQLDAATTALDNALRTFEGKIIKAGDPSALRTALSDATTIHGNAVEGTAVGQYIFGSKAILKAAMDTAQSVLDSASNKTDQQLADARDALNQSVSDFENGKVKAGDATALTQTISDATTLHTNSVEGTTVGQYVVGSKTLLQAAIDAAQSELNNALNKTDQELNDAKDALNQAVTIFQTSKVAELSGLEDVTIIGTATDSSNHVTMEPGESLFLTSGDESVATVIENPAGAIKVTGVMAGGPITIMVQVKKDGQVIKVGTFTVSIVAPISITSKAITSFDFSTKYAGQVTGNSKPMNTSNFQSQPKSFTINDGKGNIIPVNLTWNIPQNEYVKTPAAAIGSAVESAIQDYFNAHGGLNNRTVTAAGNWNGGNQGDTFRIQSFQAGSTQSITLGGQDWEYFFDQQTFFGTDEDSSQNRTFTIGDGTKNAVILLDWDFGNMSELINRINQNLQAAQVNIVAEKVSETTFKLIGTKPNGTIIIDGVDKNQFFY